MWSTVLASALLGAGVALVTSEPQAQSYEISDEPSQNLLLQGLTCQMRPDLQLVYPGPCQGAADTSQSCEYHGFVSLSTDLSTCDLVSPDALDEAIRFTPYCNDTQMSACAEATGSVWRQRSSFNDLDVPAASMVQVVVAPLISLKLGSDSGHGAIRLPPVAPAATNDDTVSPREAPQTQAHAAPSQGDAPADEVVTLETKRQDHMPGLRSDPQALGFTARSFDMMEMFTRPSGSGDKQLACMAAGLATVLFIFVVWM